MPNTRKVLDKAIRAIDSVSKKGSLEGISYEITDHGDGRFSITMNGERWKEKVKFGTVEAAEKNVRNAIGEILSYERASGKKAKIRG